jgi:imidazoleglycerol-phosphate dehydratase
MSEIRRETKETKIFLKLGLFPDKSRIDTSIGFFNHMMESFAKHSGISIELSCKGDIYVDYHHCVEDVGIVMGEALAKEIYPLKRRKRFYSCVIVMDDAAVEAAIDLGNRGFLFFDLEVDGKVGEFDCELVEEFFRALAINGRFTLHLTKKRGKNRHHIVEAAFKAAAVALRGALEKDEIEILSTKGKI